MIMIGTEILSEEIINSSFCCDLQACKGNCCIEGDAGAPLEEEEIGILEDHLEIIKPFMTEQGKKVIEEEGVYSYDAEGKFCTPLVNDAECAFLHVKGDMAMCAIEKAWEEKLIDIKKPISCHLYPIRITDYSEFRALNYHRWHICSEGEKKGVKESLPLYVFLKEPLIRKFGQDWYEELALYITSNKKNP